MHKPDLYAITVRRKKVVGNDKKIHARIVVEAAMGGTDKEDAPLWEWYSLAEVTAAERYTGGLISRTMITFAEKVFESRQKHGCDELDPCQLVGSYDMPRAYVDVPIAYVDYWLAEIRRRLDAVVVRESRTPSEYDEAMWQGEDVDA